MSDEWKPCPFCGGPGRRGTFDVFCYGTKFHRHEMIVLKPDEWNTRAPVSVQEAAKVLLSDDETCLRLAEAYDREDGAQRGDPSPHALGRDEPDYAERAQDRVGCAKAALRAIAEGGEA